MYITLKKLFNLISFNACLLIFLMIGIQNSSQRSSVNFLINKSIKLPISFIIGSSFIAGSLIGGIFSAKLDE